MNKDIILQWYSTSIMVLQRIQSRRKKTLVSAYFYHIHIILFTIKWDLWPCNLKNGKKLSFRCIVSKWNLSLNWRNFFSTLFRRIHSLYHEYNMRITEDDILIGTSKFYNDFDSIHLKRWEKRKGLFSCPKKIAF